MIRLSHDSRGGAIMAGKDISVKKYVVRLSVEEREQLETLIRKGIHVQSRHGPRIGLCAII